VVKCERKGRTAWNTVAKPYQATRYQGPLSGVRYTGPTEHR